MCLKHNFFFILLMWLLKSVLILSRWRYFTNYSAFISFYDYLPDILLQHMIDCYIVTALFVLLVINVVFYFSSTHKKLYLGTITLGNSVTKIWYEYQEIHSWLMQKYRDSTCFE